MGILASMREFWPSGSVLWALTPVVESSVADQEVSTGSR